MSARGLRLLAVDDERSQLQDLARLLRATPMVREVRCASDGQLALDEIAAQPYDAIFLDVRMPDLDGVQLARLLRRLPSPPQLVFVSAYESAAVDAFELRALDYLLKPVSRRRLEEAVLRVAAMVWTNGADGGERRALAEEPDGVVAVSAAQGAAIHLLPRSSILYAQSHGDYVRVVSAEGRYLMRATLAELERRWRPYGFVRVHRQYLANLRLAQEVRRQIGGTAQLVFAGNVGIPVARRQAAALVQRLGL